MADAPRVIYNGPSYPSGESLAVFDQGILDSMLADGWRLEPAAPDVPAPVDVPVPDPPVKGKK